MNLANKITLCRILIIPVIVVFLHFPNKIFCLVAAICLILAGLSDALDGYIARREKQVTRFGKFLDPLADKLLICSVLIMLTKLDWIPAWVTIIIIGRELMVTGLRAMAADQGVVIAADKYGKIKTIVQTLSILLLTLHHEWFGFNPVPSGQVLLYVALAVTIFSGANYLRVFHIHWLEGSGLDSSSFAASPVSSDSGNTSDLSDPNGLGKIFESTPSHDLTSTPKSAPPGNTDDSSEDSGKSAV